MALNYRAELSPNTAIRCAFPGRGNGVPSSNGAAAACTLEGEPNLMTFEYTGRHIEVTPAIRQHVEEQFKKLTPLFNGNEVPVHVILAVEKNRQTGEVIVHWLNHTLTAADTNADMYMALSRAIGKIEKQALKLKKKIVDRKQGARPTAAVAPEPDGHLEAT